MNDNDPRCDAQRDVEALGMANPLKRYQPPARPERETPRSPLNNLRYMVVGVLIFTGVAIVVRLAAQKLGLR